jgi:hypothetical protein
MDLRRPRLGRALFAALFTVAAGACGGGGGEPPPPPPPPWSGVTIEEPTDAETYVTDQPSVTLQGRAFVPDGSNCNAATGTIAPGYSVVAHNVTTGVSVGARTTLHCLMQVNLIWSAGVPLALGDNRITVTATAADGRTGNDTIVVTRERDVTPPRIVTVDPPAGAANVPVNSPLTVTFSEPVDGASVLAGARLRELPGGGAVAGSWLASSDVVSVFYPVALRPDTQYELRVEGVLDRSGNAMPAPFVSTFRTQP